MELDRSQIEQIAILARLKLTEEEKDKFSHELSGILTFVDQLGKLDTSAVPPTAHVGLEATPLRKDEPHQPLPVEDALRNAPDRKGSAFRVPRIIE